MGLYDQYLMARVRRQNADPPSDIAVVITERDLLEQGAYETLESFLQWAFDYGAERITVYVSVLDSGAVPTLQRELENVRAPREIAVRGPEDLTPADAPIQVSIGLGGKHEFAEAVRAVAEDVEAGTVSADEVGEEEIESRLVFPADPDLVIKTGAERLSDFMIWQSVYSELYFTDVNWRDFRKRDYLRAILDYKNRQRRFGR
ncbi:undecaprenyl diphosphate synthase family protein [Haladaptatus sp. AB643]|uniref:undecaprenyl diphosphate synthase family protein n=1 Tax=unclassified Haladaptatus TaxID=2622732 RepID=UPI00209C5C18|nr:undecaprenyl diphosphate synthase family protein [Haladaptatus sp. AB643]MCO8252670.1 undecaprenyl diphosphate synthase family protein [Haladaptatus sp. AB618]